MYYLTRTDQFNLNEWLYNKVKTMYLVNNFNCVTSIFILIDVRIGSKSGFAVLQNLLKKYLIDFWLQGQWILFTIYKYHRPNIMRMLS